MPEAGVVIWTGLTALILIMLAIIGFLIKNGFDGLKEQLKQLWDKLDNHQAMAEKNSQDIARLQARCEERHK